MTLGSLGLTSSRLTPLRKPSGARRELDRPLVAAAAATSRRLYVRAEAAKAPAPPSGGFGARGGAPKQPAAQQRLAAVQQRGLSPGDVRELRQSLERQRTELEMPDVFRQPSPARTAGTRAPDWQQPAPPHKQAAGAATVQRQYKRRAGQPDAAAYDFPAAQQRTAAAGHGQPSRAAQQHLLTPAARARLAAAAALEAASRAEAAAAAAEEAARLAEGDVEAEGREQAQAEADELRRQAAEQSLLLGQMQHQLEQREAEAKQLREQLAAAASAAAAQQAAAATVAELQQEAQQLREQRAQQQADLAELRQALEQRQAEAQALTDRLSSADEERQAAAKAAAEDVALLEDEVAEKKALVECLRADLAAATAGGARGAPSAAGGNGRHAVMEGGVPLYTTFGTTLLGKSVRVWWAEKQEWVPGKVLHVIMPDRIQTVECRGGVGPRMMLQRFRLEHERFQLQLSEGRWQQYNAGTPVPLEDIGQ